MRLGIVIHYWSNDRRFWPTLREQALLASKDVLVVRRDQRCDGRPEKQEDLGVPTVILPTDTSACRRMNLSQGRMAGAAALSPDCSHVLFIDSDEIPEGHRLREFRPYMPSHYLACHWYFRWTNNRAIQDKEHSGLLIETEFLRWKPRNRMDRRGLSYADKHMDQTCRENPLVHHFSWVGTKDQVLEKARNFTHHKKKNWEALVRTEWSGNFQGKDFVHGYRYETVEPPFGLPLTP